VDALESHQMVALIGRFLHSPYALRVSLGRYGALGAHVTQDRTVCVSLRFGSKGPENGVFSSQNRGFPFNATQVLCSWHALRYPTVSHVEPFLHLHSSALPAQIPLEYPWRNVTFRKNDFTRSSMYYTTPKIACDAHLLGLVPKWRRMGFCSVNDRDL
jgi:hypothetical protein